MNISKPQKKEKILTTENTEHTEMKGAKNTHS